MERLYKARPVTVKANFTEGSDDVIVTLPTGQCVVMSRGNFDATYEPVIDLRV